MKATATTFFGLLLSLATYAQDSLFTATRTIERSYAYEAGRSSVNVEGQKAEVYIDTWDQERIQVSIVLESRHPNPIVAEQNLERISYKTEVAKGNIYLRNFISKEEKPEENAPVLSVRYLIQLPKECPVYVKNHFGTAQINDLQGELQVNGEFTNIALENIKGRIDVITRFGDLEANFIDGSMMVNARRSDIILNEIKGTFDIKTQYSTIKVFSDPNLIRLNIDALRSDVFLYSTQPEIFAYDIVASNAHVDTPDWMQFKTLQDPNGLRQQFTPQNEIYANITVMINFGDLILEKIMKGGKK